VPSCDVTARRRRDRPNRLVGQTLLIDGSDPESESASGSADFFKNPSAYKILRSVTTLAPPTKV